MTDPVITPVSEALIAIEDVTKTYKTPAGPVDVLKHINLTFSAGEFTAIVGKSGSGKSTLINMITGIDHPSRGRVTGLGTNLHAMKEGDLAVWRGRNMGVVFQFFQLLPMLSVIENVLLAMDLAEIIPAEKREARAFELLEIVDLLEEAEKLPGALSGGQQQTAAIARALANDPAIIAADEPTGNLDTSTAEVIFAIFRSLVEQGKTVIMVTHDQQLAQKADRQVILSDGELIDPLLARLFPHMAHPALLQATHFLSQEISLSPGTRHEFTSTPAGLVMVRSGTVQLLPNPAERHLLLNAGQALVPGDLQPAVESGENGAIIQVIDRQNWQGWYGTRQTDLEKILSNSFHTEAGDVLSTGNTSERLFE